ncbi:cytochrome P450 [Auriscalpium vulgare]|uniref:Cytochrome P450 n=1 Tax=Auriscalpium vulgare TaxID=40419 RepID=A0ACB8REN9_9AGAM|nr:cytochrome P450 [Auriscalpium vulgare]
MRRWTRSIGYLYVLRCGSRHSESLPTSPMPTTMPVILLTAVDFLLLLACLVALRDIASRRRRIGFPHPPGPRGLPLIGNVFGIPKSRPWLVYAQWAKKYGDIVSTTAMGQNIVILTSLKTARDLFEKRAANYSDRSTLPILKLLEWDWNVPFSRYSDRWRRARKIIERSMRPSAITQYRATQLAKVGAFLKALRSTPQDLREHIGLLQGSIIMSITYGYDVKDYDDKFLKVVDDMVRLGAPLILPGSCLYNDLPILGYLPAWLPGMGFKALAGYCRALGVEARSAPMQLVQEGLKNGTAAPSVTREHLRELEENGEADGAQGLDDIASASASLYPGDPYHRSLLNTALLMLAVCSWSRHRKPSNHLRLLLVHRLNLNGAKTAAVIATFFLVLANFPDVQRKAQAEVDAISRRQRLPDRDDRLNLPYINALIQELLRWHTIIPLGIPHATLKDDIYEGYSIPKGSIVIANAWAILHDPDVYPDPDTYNPERYLTEDGQFKEDLAIAANFGFGKRVCPGRHFADSTLYLIVVSVLSTFSVRKAQDSVQDSSEIRMTDLFTDAPLSRPERFACSITPRDDIALDLISGVSA